MEPNTIVRRASAKDILLNLGAFIGLYTLIATVLNLLFTIIDTAYPKTTGNYYYGTASISWPVSILIVFFPVFILLMWLLSREYRTEPEMQNSRIHRGFTYITLFLSGLIVVSDLITVVYYFIDGRDMTTGFLLKVLVLLIIAACVFFYFISDLRGRLTNSSRMGWRVIATLIIIGSIVWGFSVLGSPRTQRMIKYDEQKASDLMNLSYQIESYYSTKGVLPTNVDEMSGSGYYTSALDPETKKPYEYIKVGTLDYKLCADFNKSTKDSEQNNSYAYPRDTFNWAHAAGHVCFDRSVKPNTYYKGGVPLPI